MVSALIQYQIVFLVMKTAKLVMNADQDGNFKMMELALILIVKYLTKKTKFVLCVKMDSTIFGIYQWRTAIHQSFRPITEE